MRTNTRRIALAALLSLCALRAMAQEPAPAPAAPVAEPVPVAPPVIPVSAPATEAAPAPVAVSVYPPLTTELSAEHPLLIFRVNAPEGAAPGAYAPYVFDAWQQLPDAFKPFSALSVNVPVGDDGFTFLQSLQDAAIPLVVRVSAGGRSGRQDVAQIENVLSTYTTIRGIEARGIRFDIYDGPDDSGDLARANATWLLTALDTAAKYGRFMQLPLAGLDAARFMAHPAYATLRMKMKELAPYLLPSSVQRGEHITQGNAGCMGLWLSGHAGAWGIAADPAWYSDLRYTGPGQFGKSPTTKPPASLYRAMVLSGAMAGAWVYNFEVPEDLWYSATGAPWNDAIAPVLGELLDLGLAPRKEFVLKSAPLAFELAEAANPVSFHKNLHDLSPVISTGVLWKEIYGNPQGPIPNVGGFAGIPLLPPGVSQDIRAQFHTVIQADPTATREQRKEVADQLRKPSSMGTVQTGRGIYIFNTTDFIPESQSYALDEVPAAVRGLEARREGAGVTLTWPFREGDVSYNVYRRISPQVRFTRLARGVEERTFSDPEVPAGETIAYAVTALTNDKEPLEGIVHYAQALVFSVVESRIAEEALLTPVLTAATGQPAGGFNAPPLDSPTSGTGLPEAHREIGQAIRGRLLALERAVESEDLTTVMGLYADEYEDPEGWRVQYVKRAYQAFFDKCDAVRLTYQVRSWDFTTFDTSGQVNVLVYCSILGNMITDPTGRNADITLEIPRTATNEILISWTGSGGTWRIQRTDPALPNLTEILGDAATN